MKWRRLSIILVLAAAALGVATPGWAHGHSRTRVGVGVYVGGPFWPWYYPYSPFYAYPSVITVPVAPAQPPVYIEQQPEAPAQQSYWYYCNSSKAYYPYTQDCPEGWQKVVPQPPQR